MLICFVFTSVKKRKSRFLSRAMKKSRWDSCEETGDECGTSWTVLWDLRNRLFRIPAGVMVEDQEAREEPVQQRGAAVD